MKKAEDHEISFTSVSGWRVSKKLGVSLAVACAVACVAVGLIVYYVGVAKLGGGCHYEDGVEPGTGQTQIQIKPDHHGSPSKAPKVCLMQNFFFFSLFYWISFLFLFQKCGFYFWSFYKLKISPSTTPKYSTHTHKNNKVYLI